MTQEQSEEENGVKPAYYYDDGNVPVFTPTMEEFVDFRAYMTKIDKYGQEAGIVKVIPPPEWRERVKNISEDKLNKISITTALRQTFLGQSGHYTQLNKPYKKKLNLKEWKTMCYSEEYKAPSVFDRSVVPAVVPVKRKRGANTKKEEPAVAAEQTENNHPTVGDTKKLEQNVDGNDPAAAESVLDQNGEAVKLTWQDFMPLGQQVGKSVEYYKDLERSYWKNLTFGDALYGADIEGSLFEESETVWNVAKLDNVLNCIKKRVPGVNTAYLYFGMYKASFAWHLEDMDLYSINYIHFGAAKQWFVVPPDHYARFQIFAESLYPEASRICHEFLRHKMYVISPTRISDASIPVNKCVQEEGEFIITYPYGYHSGFNTGYNCAESINFALERWIDIGRKEAQACKCVSHSVMINVDAIFGPSKAIEEKKADICEFCGRSGKEAKIMACDLLIDGTLVDVQKVHLSCARAISELTVREEGGRTVAIGYSYIPEIRWKLSCKFCDYEGGAPIQCIKGKCTTAYHLSCAREQGIILNFKNDEDGTEFCESYCLRHDPKLEADKKRCVQEREDYICTQIDKKQFKVYAKWSDGEYYEGTILKDFREKRMCKIHFFDGYIKAVAYNSIMYEPLPVKLRDF